MDKFKTIESNLLMSLAMIMIIVFVSLKRNTRSVPNRLYLGLCWSTLIVLIFDAAAMLVDKNVNGNWIWLNYLTNFLLFLFMPLPFTIWMYYTDFILNKTERILKKRWYFSLPFFLTILVMFYSAFTGLIFYVDKNNVYHRGPGCSIMILIYILLFLYSFILAIQHRRTAGKKILSLILFFGIAPILGLIVQLINYGILVIWPSVGLMVVLVYMFLETQREIRDYLTGLLNRQQIDEIIHSRIINYSRKGGFGLIMIDMDGFKQINDLYGHSRGDEALVQLSTVLLGHTKSRDRVARFGGDEFIVLVESDDEGDIEKIIDRIQNKIKSINEKSNKPYKIAISAGYTLYSPEKHQNITQLLNDADEQMYRMKAERKKTITGTS